MNFLTTSSNGSGARVIRDLIDGNETTYNTGTPDSASKEVAMSAAELRQNGVIQGLIDGGFASKADTHDVTALRSAYIRSVA